MKNIFKQSRDNYSEIYDNKLTYNLLHILYIIKKIDKIYCLFQKKRQIRDKKSYFIQKEIAHIANDLLKMTFIN